MNVSEKPDIINNDTKDINSKFAKTLSSFKTTKKNTISQNLPSTKYSTETVKKPKILKNAKSLKTVKSKRVSLSNQKTKSTDQFIISTEANQPQLSDSHTPIFSTNYYNTNNNSINNNTNCNNQNNGGNISNNSENKNNGGDNSLKENISNTNNNMLSEDKPVCNVNSNIVKNNGSGINNVSNNSGNSNKNTDTKNKLSKRYKNKNNNNISRSKKINLPKVKTNNFVNLKNNNKNVKNKSKPATTKNSKETNTNISNTLSTNNIKEKKINTNEKLDKNNKYKNKNFKNNKINIESNNENNTDLLINEYKFYPTVDENDLLSKNDVNNFLNTLPNNFSNNRNDKKGLNAIKSLNSMKSYQQEINNSFNKTADINENYSCCDIIKKNIDNENNLASQTYSGPFHKNSNIIKVNMIDNNIENINITEYNMVVYSNRKSTKSNNKNIINNSININKGVINSGWKPTAKKNLYIETDFQIKNKKSKILTNKKTTDPNIKIKNEKKSNNDNNMYKSQIESVNNSKDLQNFKTNNKNLYTNNVISTSVDAKGFLLMKDKSKAYVKKKTPSMTFNGKKKDFQNITNKDDLTDSKFFSPDSCYNTHRSINKNLIEDTENLYYNYNQINFNSAKINNKVSTKLRDNPKIQTMYEYRYKLEKIKSRVVNLLGVYSLLALKGINTNDKENNNI